MTNNSWNNQIAAAKSAITLNSGTNNVNISTDAANTTVAIGSGAGVKAVTLGSTNTTSATTVQSGSGALAVTSTNGTLTINSGTGALGISTDASATTVSFASGAAAKTVTLGSTNSTSSLALRYGTNDFTLASATGTIMNALDTGEITYPLQPAFNATVSAAQNNVTGAGTLYTVNFANELYDTNGDYDGTNTFTAPTTGRYLFSFTLYMSDITAAMTNGSIIFFTTAFSLQTYQCNFANMKEPAFGVLVLTSTAQRQMTAGDVAYVQLRISNGAGDTADIPLNSSSVFAGRLVS